MKGRPQVFVGWLCQGFVPWLGWDDSTLFERAS